MTAFINGEVRPIAAQGRTSTGHGITIYAPQKGNRAAISSILISDSAAYEVSVYRKTSLLGPNKPILLYNLGLSAGNIIDDSIGYHLMDGDSLYLVPNVGAVNYVINGLEYEKNCQQPPFGIGGKLRIIEKNGRFKVKTSDCCKDQPLKPLIGIVDRGGANDPVSGTSVFQSDDLIGLGDEIMILIDDMPLFNFGLSIGFNFNSVTGEIDLSPNEWGPPGSGLYVDLNQ